MFGANLGLRNETLEKLFVLHLHVRIFPRIVEV
jgi:hypothetical protein